MIEVKRCKRKSKEKLKNIHKKSDTRSDLDCLFPGNSARKKGLVDSVYSYQSSFGFASGQIPRRSQGTLLPLSVRTQGIESVEQCAMQGLNLVKQGKLSFEEPSCI
jgi:hypothetical protein